MRSKTVGKSKVQAGEFSKKSKLLCIFCGGKNCPKENHLKNPHKNAIHGLHSDWITPDILAMQRPSSRLIKEHSVIEQFKNAHIKAVFNLQLPGEHPYCGDNLIKESGFTYKPEDFTDRKQYVFSNNRTFQKQDFIKCIKDGIFYFNFGWTDMEVTNNDYMIKILTHIDFIISQGMKISVHCHAGTGRTGLLIASWLILKNNMKATEARELFRSKRVGGLSKSKQLTFLKEFEQCINKILQQIYFNQEQNQLLAKELNKDRLAYLNTGKISFWYQPFIMYQVLSRLEFMMDNNRINATQLCASFYDLDSKEAFGESKWGSTQEHSITQLKEYINQFQWLFSNYGDVRVISQVLLDFFDQKNLQVVKNESAMKLNEYFLESKSLEMVFADESIVELLGRYEYSILSRFLVFVKINFIDKNVNQTMINQFILRICISLLGKRQELDNLFIERSFLTTECFNPVVFSLYQFLTAWANDLVENKMQDNSYFDRIFNRTSCIIEGRIKQQSSVKKGSKLETLSAIKNRLQTKPENILIGSHLKSEASEIYSRSEIKSIQNYTDVNQPMSQPFQSPVRSFQSEIIRKVDMNDQNIFNKNINIGSSQKNGNEQEEKKSN